MAKILVVDDDRGVREMLEIMLKKEGYEVSCVSNGIDAVARCTKDAFDVVLTDIRMPKLDGFGVLQRVKELNPKTKVIMITAYGSLENAIESMKEAAFDYITKTKPFDVEEIKDIIKNALSHPGEETGQLDSAAPRGGQPVFFENMAAASAPMEKIFALIPKAAASKTNVLICGESGTGKELVARAIHNLSPRRDKPFIPLNCGGIPETLLESELFGHKKGSFTGAVTDKIGLFQAANGGTVFLDEIGDLPLFLQVKLLRAVQERSFKPVGETEDVRVDIRIISATNMDLERRVIEGKFREDLFYRLNVIHLSIPPLRERKEDIRILAEHFLSVHAKEQGKNIKRLSSHVLKLLTEYDFPGNVRELENIIERSVALEDSNIILPQSLELSRFKVGAIKPNSQASRLDQEVPEEGIDLEKVVEDFEKQLLRKALEKTHGMKKRAAELLNLSYRSLRHKLDKYQMGGRDE
jgi:two-component system response regulator PilR (NtrC family)